MRIQYIAKNEKKGNNVVKKLIGVMVAFTEAGRLKLGYSLLNPADAKIIHQENLEAKKRIAELKREAKIGKGEVPEAPKIRPVFDRKEAVRLAKEAAVNLVDRNGLPTRIRSEFYIFCRKAVGAHHIESYVR